MSSMEGMILGVGANNCGAFSLYVVESVYLHYRLLNQVFSSFTAGGVNKKHPISKIFMEKISNFRHFLQGAGASWPIRT